MVPPKGYSKATNRNVCKFKHSLYGHDWNHELTNKLQHCGFRQSWHVNCLFIIDNKQYLLALLVYVDDILITGTSEEEISEINFFYIISLSSKTLDMPKIPWFRNCKIFERNLC